VSNCEIFELKEVNHACANCMTLIKQVSIKFFTQVFFNLQLVLQPKQIFYVKLTNQMDKTECYLTT